MDDNRQCARWIVNQPEGPHGIAPIDCNGELEGTVTEQMVALKTPAVQKRFTLRGRTLVQWPGPAGNTSLEVDIVVVI
jgi:hypothetical protein